MKKQRIIVGIFVLLLAAAVLVVCLTGCTEKGSEETVQGTIVDLAMAKVHEEDFRARSYISLEFEDGTAQLFWFSRPLARRDLGLTLGERVQLETAIEAATGLRVVTGIAVLK